MQKKQVFSLKVCIVIAILLVSSCQKELECPNCPTANQSPVARAGPNLIITLPIDTVTLNAFQSYDPDGTITDFLWTNISGPASVNISNSDSVIMLLEALVIGNYNIELKVTDNGGLTSSDTVTVTVIAPGQTNIPPVARAGLDQIIHLPDNDAILDASSSYDPDGTVALYLWRQISGPNQSLISNPSQMIAVADSLFHGAYQFVLEVTDNNGLNAQDTVEITIHAPIDPCAMNRPFINAQLVSVGTLSEARQDLYTATVGNKILFAGGLKANFFVSSRVDIYDFVSNTWSTAELSKARHAMTVATVGNKILFAGGVDQWNGIKYNDVDIYDAQTNTWSTANLSEGRGYLASATLGNKVFFAGGWYWYNQEFFMNDVDIYDNVSNTWTTASLSEARAGLSATTVGNKIYFAGGSTILNATDKVEVYDGTTNQWSTIIMIEPKTYFGSVAFSNKILWAGGVTSVYPTQVLSSQVEIKDVGTGVSVLTCLSQAKASFGIAKKGNEIVFFMGGSSDHPNNFDIYNSLTGAWSIGKLNEGFNYPSIISANNKIFVAGGESVATGTLSNKVSLLVW